VLRGYNVGGPLVDFKMKEPDEHCIAAYRRGATFGSHHPVAVIAPIRVVGSSGVVEAVSFMPDQRNAVNQLVGAMNRYATKMPGGDPAKVAHWLAYAKEFITKAFDPVHPEDVPDWEYYCDSSSYSCRRLIALLSGLVENEGVTDRDLLVQSFIKDEGWEKYKAPRMINSYSDLLKVILCRLCKSIDKATFNGKITSKWFVKGKAPKEWPQMLLDAFSTFPVIETDYTAFESHMRHERAELIMHWFQHMTSQLDVPFEMELIRRCVQGVNKCQSSGVTIEVEQRLMSGALWTSSANGVLNLCLMSYFYSLAQTGSTDIETLVKNSIANFRGFCEGDDGITLDVGQDETILKDYGLILDFERRSSFAEANFCGVTCDPGELTVLADPRKTLRNFFLLPKQYIGAKLPKLAGLLRAKALSTKYNYGNCPIIGALADWVLRVTRHYSTISIDAYKDEFVKIAEREKVWEHKSSPTPGSRVAMYTAFGIDPESQMILERILENCDTLVCQLPLELVFGTEELKNMKAHLDIYTNHVENNIFRDCPAIYSGVLTRKRKNFLSSLRPETVTAVGKRRVRCLADPRFIEGVRDTIRFLEQKMSADRAL